MYGIATSTKMSHLQGSLVEVQQSVRWQEDVGQGTLCFLSNGDVSVL